MGAPDSIPLLTLAKLAARQWDNTPSVSERDGIYRLIQRIERATGYPLEEATAEAYQDLLCDRA